MKENSISIKAIIIAAIAFIITIAASVSISSFLFRDKTAFVDTSQLMAKLKIIKSLNERIEAMKNGSQAKLDTLHTEFETALKKYEKEMTKMSPKEKQLSKELLQIKQRQIGEYEQAVGRKNHDEQQHMTQDILEKVNTKITEYGKSKGYELIFATNGGNIVYGIKNKDITEQIIEYINTSN